MTAYLSEENLQPKKTNQLRWDLISCVFLGVIFWVGRYWQFARFGLYEDDLTIIPNAISMNFTELFRYIGSYIVHLYGHGRPLSDSFIYLFSNLGWRLDGLKGIYLIGFLLTLINIILFYALLKRISNRNIALIGSVIYTLYAADTTQVFLTHSLGAQPSITLLLLAFHTYLSDRKIIAYTLSAIILFSYETPFLVFMAAPLLQKKWGRPIIKKITTHVAILFVLLAATFLLRLQIGEGRVSGLSTQQMLISPITHSMIGPLVSLGTYLLRPYQVIRGADVTMILAFGLSVIPLFVLFFFLKWDIKNERKYIIRFTTLEIKVGSGARGI